MNWKNKPIIFVTGKGGVGKSAVSGAIASRLAESGHKTLLVELGETSYYQRALGIDAVQYKPISLGQNLDLALWSGEKCLREYVLHYIPVEKVFELFFRNKVMRSLLNIAPAVNELSVVGKLTSQLRGVGPRMDYDHIVVDAFSTGHAKALLNAARGMSSAVSLGPMGKESRSIDQILCNSQHISYVLVTLLEELPVTETLEMKLTLQNQMKQEPLVIANRCLSSPLEMAGLKGVAENEKEPLHEFARYLWERIQQQSVFMDILKRESSFVTSLPMCWQKTGQDLWKGLGESL